MRENFLGGRVGNWMWSHGEFWYSERPNVTALVNFHLLFFYPNAWSFNFVEDFASTSDLISIPKQYDRRNYDGGFDNSGTLPAKLGMRMPGISIMQLNLRT